MSTSGGMAPRTFRLDAAGLTDIGRRRQRNEDSYLLTETLLAVADGAGGHPGGDVASTTTVELLQARAAGLAPTPAGLSEVFVEAHRAVVARARRDPRLAEMCTTLCALALDPAGAVVLANVGDSRIYRVTEGSLTQVTRDHSWGSDLILEGMDPQEAWSTWGAATLTRVVGAFPVPSRADTWTLDAVAGDRYLLTSDGLTNELPDRQIAEVLTGGATPEQVCRELVSGANEQGGRDNITVIVADVLADDSGAGSR